MFEFITDLWDEMPSIEWDVKMLLTVVFTLGGWAYFYFMVFKYFHPSVFIKLLCYVGMPVCAYVILQVQANR